MADENKNKKRSVIEDLFGRLDPEDAKEREEWKKKKISEKIKDFFIQWSDDGKKRLFRKHICATDKFYLLGSPRHLLPRDAVKLMFSDDPEVRKLQRKTTITHAPGLNDPDDEEGYGTLMRKALQDETDKPLDEVCKKGIPKYIYEPNVRYKRTENPDYKRHRNYSIAGILTGTGLLATGLASFNYALAYAGAALTLASFGYQSGHWIKKRKTDQSFEKLPLSLSELEKKAQKPSNPDSHYLSNHAGSLSDIAAKEAYKDDALYVRRLYEAYPPRVATEMASGWRRIPFHYASFTDYKAAWSSGWGALGAALTGVFASMAGLMYADSSVTPLFPAATMLSIAGSTALATLGHYVGYIFGNKDAKPEYQKA